jgi:60 kDa SS-A/Ro ribonucleoprotein
MANKALFATRTQSPPKPDTRNREDAPAYAFTPKHALAQYAATGCLNSTFYADAGEQLDLTLALCGQVEDEFVARTAVFCRERSHAKDMPALLCAVLAKRNVALLERVFPRVIDNARMLRNFVQIVRSGVAGRRSFGSAPRRLVRRWLEVRDDDALFRASLGRAPSFGDIVSLVHPKPATGTREALYAYLVGHARKTDALPALVKEYEAFKRGETLALPDVPMEMLTALPLSAADWREIARRAPWQATRMNLNTFARQGVFGAKDRPQTKEEKQVTRIVADRLRDPAVIRKARVLPYQLLAAWANADSRVPDEVREALQDAMDVSLANVPKLPGKVYVLPDVSGSMQSPVTGRRKGATAAVRCLDVAALVAAAVLRKNPLAEVLPFNDHVVPVTLNPRDAVMTNATKLASLPQGGTNCSAPLKELNRHRSAGDVVIFVSDNQSWVDAGPGTQSTGVMKHWAEFKERNPQARLVCIDVQPYANSQAREGAHVLNVGGFSDQVFDTLAAFATGRLSDGHWVAEIEAVEV